jgi:hypothetical protein
MAAQRTRARVQAKRGGLLLGKVSNTLYADQLSELSVQWKVVVHP